MREPSPTDDSKHVKSIEKALNILLLFTEEKPELSHTEIARAMGWTTSTTSRLLGTLQSKRFLVKSPDSGKYMLGSVIYYLGRIARNSTDLQKVSAPVLHRLREQTGETVHIFVRDGIYRTCYAQAESRQLIKQSTEIGVLEPLWVGATGATLLAFQRPEDMAVLMAQIKRQHKEVDLEDLLRRITTVRNQGYCVKDGSTDDTHVGCVVAPIFDAGGNVNACLGISTPEFRFPQDPSPFIVLAKEGAWEISEQLGYISGAD